MLGGRHCPLGFGFGSPVAGPAGLSPLPEPGPTPIAIRVVGALQGKAPGAHEWRPIGRLSKANVDPLSGGPYVVDAWTLTPALYRGDANRCTVGKTFVRVMWSNGLTAYPTGEEVGAPVTASYRALYKFPAGKTVRIADSKSPISRTMNPPSTPTTCTTSASRNSARSDLTG